MSKQDIVDTAYTIALINLRNRYTYYGINAGRNHFSDLWARDFCFAGWGSLLLKDFTVVKNGLSTLLKFMSPEGQIPLRVGQKHFLLKYMFGIQGKIQARFIEDKNVSISVDNNPLFLILLERYIQQSKDLSFLKLNYQKCMKAIKWQLNQTKDNDYLMVEGAYAGWADSLKKRGKVLYTNVLHYKSLNAIISLSKQLEKKENVDKYTTIAKEVKKSINRQFWKENYYIDWVDNKKKRQFFSSDGNLLAILFGISDLEQSRAIIQTIKDKRLEESACIGTNHPKYPPHFIYPPFWLINMSDYHNGLYWLWLGCLHSVALDRLGFKDEARKTLFQIAHKIVEFKGVYEAYCGEKPVDRLFYHSEDGFAWSAGLYVWACKEVKLR